MADEEVSQEVLDGVEGVDEELEAMKSKVKEMEEEAEKLRKIQEQVEDSLQGDEAGGEGGGEDGATDEADARSIYVGQVDYSATPEELQEHFASCGTVNRVTIICDRFGNPKGFAYIEFAETEAVEAAVVLNDSEFKGRQLKVTPKRTNVHGFGGKGGGGKGGGKGGKGGKGKGGKGGKGWYDPWAGKGKGYKGGYGPVWKPYGRGRGYRPY